MSKNKNLFSKEVKEIHIVYRFLGIKFSIKNPEFYNKLKQETKEAIKIQNKYDLTSLKNTKKLVLFLTPAGAKVCGGVMSIFSLCETSRKFASDSLCIISTYPKSKYTYANNDKFLNDEKIYRFSQIIDNCKNLEELIIHIPDYYSQFFYKDLKHKDRKFLKSMNNLHLNIMNQNIELMPEPKKLQNLYKLTSNITQTIAHKRYATQEVCNKWQIPTHLFSVNIDLERYKTYSFEEKEKIIVLSPDEHEYREKVVNALKQNLPDWKLVTVQNMSFSEYMDLISRAFFTITFGEGMDGYLNQPFYKNSIGFAVYNENFFPSKEWGELKNIYSSYEEMLENICKDLKDLYSNKTLFSETIENHKKLLTSIYQLSDFNDNLRRFYEKNYDFIPQIKGEK